MNQTLDTNEVRDALTVYQVPDEKAEELAEYEQPSWAGPHCWSVAPVFVKGGEIKVGSPRTYQGNEHPLWDDDVLFALGIGASTPAGIRASFRENRSLYLYR